MDEKEHVPLGSKTKPLMSKKLLDLVGRLGNALDQANQKIEELTKKLAALTKTTKLDKPYSVSAHEQREQDAATGKSKKRKRNKNRDIKRGRQTNQAKLKAAVELIRSFLLTFQKAIAAYPTPDRPGGWRTTTP